MKLKLSIKSLWAYAAKDDNGEVWLFEDRPQRNRGIWSCDQDCASACIDGLYDKIEYIREEKCKTIKIKHMYNCIEYNLKGPVCY
jgi:hypothetical protein